MILEPTPPPPEALAAAHSLLEELPPDDEPVVVASLPIPVHEIRAPVDGRWQATTPLSGWAFPVFDEEGVELVRILHVAADLFPRVEEAPPGGPLRRAFAVAWGTGAAQPCGFRLRMVVLPSGARAFWLQGADSDGFVSVETAELISGPELVGILRAWAEGGYADLVAADHAEGEGA
jgi:hypothetical protein